MVVDYVLELYNFFLITNYYYTNYEYAHFSLSLRSNQTRARNPVQKVGLNRIVMSQIGM